MVPVGAREALAAALLVRQEPHLQLEGEAAPKQQLALPGHSVSSVVAAPRVALLELLEIKKMAELVERVVSEGVKAVAVHPLQQALYIRRAAQLAPAMER